MEEKGASGTALAVQNALVLDANILIRAVLGRRARDLILAHHQNVWLLTPDICVDDARRYLPRLAAKRALDASLLLRLLDTVVSLMDVLPDSAYRAHEATARQRLAARDEDDWHILALAIAVDAPIWTEDRDFFGTGVATWTMATVDEYLSAVSKPR